MAKLITKQTIAPLAVFLLLLIFYPFVWHAIGKTAASAHLKQVSNQEMQPLIESVNGLMQGAVPRRILECNEVSHTYTKTQLYCQHVNLYAYNPNPLPDSSRSKIIAEAALLDKALAQNGWKVDRPQDKAKTVVTSIPTISLESFHGGGVPFHKNIGNISCNFEVSFVGPTDGTSPGVINIYLFSCQQNITYFMIRASNYVNKGFGG